MLRRWLAALLLFPLAGYAQTAQTPEELARMEQQNATLRGIVGKGDKLPYEQNALPIQAPGPPGWATGMVSWVASSRDGLDLPAATW